jgi:hypothetical protein
MTQNNKSGLLFIIPGNKNVNTFANTLRAITNYWKHSTIEAV